MALSLDGTTGITSDGGTPVIENLDTTATGIAVTGSLSVLTGATDTAGLIVGGDTNPANTWTIARDSISTGDLKFIGNTTERMRITAAGNVGVGTNSPAAKLSVYGATENQIRVTDDPAYYYSIGRSSTQGFLTFYGSQAAATGYIFTGAAGERMRIDSSGNLLVGTTSIINYGKTSIAFNGSVSFGASYKTTYGFLGSTFVGFINSAGTAQGAIYANTTSSVQYLTSSDYRLKENIAPMTGALAKVSALKPVTYNWKVDGSSSQGFIAHELAEVSPECVGGEKDAVDANGNPKYQGVDTSFLVATLTAAIQEQQAIIESLTARVSALEASNV